MLKNSKLLLSKNAKQLLEEYLNNPFQGLLIVGSKGSGKTSILDLLASELLAIDLAQVQNSSYILRLAPEGSSNSISIASVHQIDRFFGRSVSLPKGKHSSIARIVIIDDAEKMSIEAQNALLKNLEEPSKNSVFLLSCSDTNKILATLISRVRSIRLTNPSRIEIKEFLRPLSKNDAIVEQAINMSGGVPGLAIALALNQDEHSLFKASTTLKQILNASIYERLLLINTLYKDMSLVTDVLYLMQQMSRLALETAETKQSIRWQKILNIAYITEKYLEKNTNPKLTLTNLMLNL